MAARDPDPVPLVGMEGVLNEVVGAAVGVDKGDPVAAVPVDEVIDDEGPGVPPGDGDPAAALRAAVAEDAVPLEVDRLVLVDAPQEGNGLAPGPGDGEAADRDEFRLPEADGMAVGAPCNRPLEDDAANRCPRVGLDDDPVGLVRPREIVLPLDGDLLGVGPAWIRTVSPAWAASTAAWMVA